MLGNNLQLARHDGPDSYYHAGTKSISRPHLPTMSGAQSIKGITRTIGTRAVHVQMHPRPEFLSDSREILRLLQSYGKVETFKNLKYDALPAPNTMLVIFQTEEAAQRLLRRSPLRFNMSRDQIDDDSVVESPDTANDSSNPFGRQQQNAASMRRPQPGSAERQIQLQINLSTMHHRDHINANPYNGPFSVDTKSVIQEDLAKRVPTLGLSDVNLKKPEKPWKVLLWEREREKKQRKTLRQMLEAS